MKPVFTPLDIPDVLAIKLVRHGDRRGFFSETWNAGDFAAAGISNPFVQDNHSLSAEVGTIRGLHFQTAPKAQGKLIRVIAGAIMDVALDIRPESPTFGRHVSLRISAEDWNSVYIPQGFAHGFCTLAPDTEVLYKVNDFYDPDLEYGVLWNDPALGIDWPVNPEDALLSEKDRGLPVLSDLDPKLLEI